MLKLCSVGVDLMGILYKAAMQSNDSKNTERQSELKKILKFSSSKLQKAIAKKNPKVQ